MFAYINTLKVYPSLPIISLTIGIVISVLVQLFIPFQAPILIAFCCIVFVFVALYYGRFFLLGLILGIVAISFNASTPYPHSLYNCEFDAVISQPNYSNKVLRREVILKSKKIKCKNATLYNQYIQYWDNKQIVKNLANKTINISASLIPIRSHLNPYSFDYEKYMIAQGIRFSAKDLTIKQINNVNTTGYGLLKLKDNVSKTIQKHLSPANASIILALLTGNRSALTSEQKITMQKTGTSHLLAISGLHLALVGGIVWIFFQWIWALSWRLSDKILPKHIGAIVALIAITFYATFTGFDIPIKRAWIMFSLIIIAWILGKGLTHNSLLIAVCLVVISSPYSLVSVGFYLSFIATFIILWCTQLPYSPLTKIIIMQILVNLTLLPITWGIFGIVSFSALCINLIIIPWLSLWVLPFAILASITSVLSETISEYIWSILNQTTTMMWNTIAFFEQLNWSITPLAIPTLSVIIIAIVSVLITLISKNKLFLLGLTVLLLPLYSSRQPEIIVSDQGYTSALIHDGEKAIIVNPGYRYRHINKAKMWQHYLHQNNLTLVAIVLTSDKVTRISATKWLLGLYPQATIMTTIPLQLPYVSNFCKPLRFDKLSIVTHITNKKCNVSINWQGINIGITNSNSEYAIHNKAVLIWEGKKYSVLQRGAITVTKKNGEWLIHSLRDEKRLWRQGYENTLSKK